MSAGVDFASLVVKADSRELVLLKKAMAEVERQAGKTEKSTTLLDRSTDKLSNSFKGLLLAVGGYITINKAIDGFKALTTAGSDLYETINKGAVVLGDSFAEVEKFAEGAASAIGQSKKQAIDAASTFGIFGKSAGLSGKELSDFSIQFTKLASDFASFYNTSPEDAITAIGAAMRGENEPIRRYGVLLDDVTLRQEAMAAGIVKTTTKALTPQQKVLAASRVIMRQSIDAQDDFARTSEGMANQQRILAAELENVKATIGEELIPIMREFYDLALQIAQNKELINFFTDIARGIAWTLGGEKQSKEKLDQLTEEGNKYKDLIALRKAYDAALKSEEESFVFVKATGDYVVHTLSSARGELGLLQKDIAKLGGGKVSSKGKTKTGSTSTTGTGGTKEDTSWEDFGDTLKKTSDINEQKLAIVENSNNAIRAENKRLLDEDIARDETLQQYRENAEMARLNNISDNTERELAINEYKFSKLKEIYKEGSEELIAIEKWQTEERNAIFNSANRVAFDAGEDFFGSMASITKTFAGEQSRIYKAMFTLSKLFALAKIALKAGEAESEAAASAPPPYNLVPMAIAAAQIGGIIAEVMAVNFAGAKDKGGRIPSGMWGIAGEYGPEIINGPATVVSRKDTAKLLGGDGGGSQVNIDVNVNGNFIGNNAAMRDLAIQINKQLQSELTRRGAVA